MEMMKKVQALILGLVVLLAFGCGKDEGGTPEPEKFTTCKLNKFNTGKTEYTYFYDLQGNNTKVNSSNGDVEIYEYNTLGKVERFIKLQTGTDTLFFNTYEYNSDTLLSKMTFWFPDSNGSFAIKSIQTFEYNAQGKRVNSYIHNIAQPTLVESKFNYTYLANNKVIIDFFNLNSTTNSWSLDSQSEIIFDDKKRPWGNNDAYIYILDANEVSQIITTYDNGVIRNVTTIATTYTYNANGYPLTSVRASTGRPNINSTYTYTCQ